jgi:uncharacterized protein
LRKRLRRLLILLVAAAACWHFGIRWWAENNPRLFCGRLENAVNEELTRFGLADHDILSQVRQEESRWGQSWVETSRRFRLPSSSKAHELAKRLTALSDQLGGSVSQTETSQGLTIFIRRFGCLMQKVTLVSAPTVKGKVPKVAFVIDDVAYDLPLIDRYADLGSPVTLAILPGARLSRALADKAYARHLSVLMHLPMEPLDLAHNDPGPCGLYLKMTDAELKSRFEKNLATIPHAVGINNHMGSAFTENEPKMERVMEWVKAQNLFFLDSRTSSRSVVCVAAKKFGVPCRINETFLDNEDNLDAIEKQLDQVLILALSRGQTIAIGHYRRKYLAEALAQKLPEFKARGVEVVALPDLFQP